jgi:hypothetical protein
MPISACSKPVLLHNLCGRRIIGEGFKVSKASMSEVSKFQGFKVSEWRVLAVIGSLETLKL